MAFGYIVGTEMLLCAVGKVETLIKFSKMTTKVGNIMNSRSSEETNTKENKSGSSKRN